MVETDLGPDSSKTILQYGLAIIEPGKREEEIDAMVNEFASRLQQSGRAPDIARHLFDHAPRYVQSGDHTHAPYKSGQEKGKGLLFTVSKIPANSNPDVELHDHPMPEYTILIEGRIQSVLEPQGKRIAVETTPLVPHKITPGVRHSAINPGPIDAYYFCIRPTEI